MMSTSSLLAETGGGEQIVRRPRPADAIGAALRDAYGGTVATPEDMLRLLRRLNGSTRMNS